MDGGLIMKDPNAEKIYGKKVELKEQPVIERKARRTIQNATLGFSNHNARQYLLSAGDNG